MVLPRGVVVGFILGIVLGGVGGAVAGAHLAGWNGGLIGGYGGVVCGLCLLGGLGGVVSRETTTRDRDEAVLTLVFGVFAAAGAVAGYWLGTRGIPRLSPVLGYFAGLTLPGLAAGLTAAKLMDDLPDAAILGLLFLGPIGAGLGAWLGLTVGSPVVVAIGLVVGSVLGTALAHKVNTSIDGPHDPVARHHGW